MLIFWAVFGSMFCRTQFVDYVIINNKGCFMLNLNLSVEVLKAILDSYHLSKDPTTIKTFYKCMKEACNSFNLTPEKIHEMIMEVR